MKLEPLSPNTITDPEGLRREFKGIRAKGLSRGIGEQFEDHIGVPAPVIGWDGKVSPDLFTDCLCWNTRPNY